MTASRAMQTVVDGFASQLCRVKHSPMSEEPLFRRNAVNLDDDSTEQYVVNLVLAYERGGASAARRVAQPCASYLGHAKLPIFFSPTLLTPRGLRTFVKLLEDNCIDKESELLPFCPLCYGAPGPDETDSYEMGALFWLTGERDTRDTAWRDDEWRAALLDVLRHPLVHSSKDCKADVCAAYGGEVPLSAIVVVYAGIENDVTFVRAACADPALADGLRAIVNQGARECTLEPHTRALAVLFDAFPPE